MSPSHDPLHEPLRLLRETSLAAGFEERLALRLAEAQRGDGVAPVIRLPRRRRTLLVVAAIVLPAAAAAAAAGYWVRQHSAAVSPEPSLPTVQAEHVNQPPRIAVSSGTPLAVSAAPVQEESSAVRQQPASRTGKSNARSHEKALTTDGASRPAAPLTNEVPRIEALDPFVPHATGSAKATSVSKGPTASESLRKATEDGANHQGEARVRGSRHDVNSNENRGNDAAGQARERVQARERKGQ